MKQRLFCGLTAALLMCGLTACGRDESPANTAAAAPDAQTAAASSAADAPISTGYIDAGGSDYVPLFQHADSQSVVIARLYTGDAIDIMALEGQWYRLSVGELIGYVPAVNVVFQKPADTTAAPAVTTAADTSQTAPPAAAAQPPQTTAKPAQTAAAAPPAPAAVHLEYASDGVALPSSYPGYSAYNSETEGYCKVSSCKMYKTPSTDSPKREVEMLYKDDPVTIYGEYNGYYYLGTESGGGYDWYGYVQKKNITVGTAPLSYRKNYQATHGYVDANSCHVRSTPSKESSSNIMDTVYNGMEFTINSFDGFWYNINYYGGTGYISYKMVIVS